MKNNKLHIPNPFANSPGVFAVMLFLMGITMGSVFSQDRGELERNKRQIEQQIALINQMLRETQSSAELNVSQLMILNNRISSRQNLINNLNAELSLLNRQINNLTREQEQLEKELEELKESYARMIYYAYRNRSSYQRMMFIFSSKDFNQAYLRLRYLQQIARHRQVQAEKIVETTERLRESIEELEVQKAEQQQVLARQREEVAELTKEREEHTRNVNQLKRKERELMQQLREQEKAARDLQQAIERVLAEERRKAEEAARAAGRPTAEAFRLTPEDRIISTNFAENKGSLPWPLERGIITAFFGEQPHPVLPGIKIVNNGIDISTTQGSRARAIFEGTVSRVISIQGGYAVIIRHGEYLSVYANLSEVLVAQGQKVQVRQDIGVVATDAREAKTFVNLQVWHGNNKLNPAEWISRQR
jgi:septal ring factor EnvC (AmiA/AmiB activator)